MGYTDKIPHVLTIDELDELCDDYHVEIVRKCDHGLSPHVLNVIERLVRFADARLYTQVDTDFSDRVYVQGLCIVNSTGVYAIVTPK